MNYLKSLIFEDDKLTILDQTLLPSEIKYIEIKNLEEGCDAIKKLKVRGAPAIGVMAGFLLFIEIKRLYQNQYFRSIKNFLEKTREISNIIKTTRPTAVNLFTILDRIIHQMNQFSGFSIEEYLEYLKKIVNEIYKEDIELCEKIGEYGSQLIFDGAVILTHCNTGSLATAGIGTAVGAIYKAHFSGKKIKVYNTETRPLLQGSRLTSFELLSADIPSTLITDNMVGMLLSQNKVDIVMVGADRITRNGDVANKIGTLSIAIIAKYYSVPFYVLAPSTTLDLNLSDGSQIIIEQRESEEVKKFLNCISAPTAVDVYNPAFDITPSHLITAIITEKGIFRYPYNF